MAYSFSQYVRFLDAVVFAGIPTRFPREEARIGITANYFFLPESRYNKEWFEGIEPDK